MRVDKIDGRNYHWNEPREGLKYGTVLYRQKAKYSKQQQMLHARQKKQEQQQEQEQEQKTEHPESNTERNTA